MRTTSLLGSFLLGTASVVSLSLHAAKPAVQEGPPLKVLYEGDPKLLTTHVQMVFKTGSIQDPAKKRGTALLLSELLLRGTREASRTEFQTALERMGGTLNASQAHDQIVFSGEVIQEKTVPFLKLMEAAIARPSFDKREFEALRTEAINAINSYKNSNGMLAMLALYRKMYAGTLFEIPGTGNTTSLKAIQLTDLVQYYNQNLTQSNLFATVASPVPEAKLRKHLEAISRALPVGNPAKDTLIPPKMPAKNTLIVVKKPKTATGTMILAQNGLRATDEERYPLGVGDFIFGGSGFVSRLFTIIRSDLGWTYAIGSTYLPGRSLSAQVSPYFISATPLVEYSAKAFFKVQELWNQYVKKGVTAKELATAQQSLINSYAFTFESAKDRAGNRAYSELYGVPILSPEDYTKKIMSISEKEILAALASKHTTGPWWAVMVGDPEQIGSLLAEEQKETPAENRWVIDEVVLPDSLTE